MPKKNKPRKNNLQLAGLFILLVLGLIFLSLVFKLFLVFRESKFDGNHKFNVLFINEKTNSIVSFTAKPRSLLVVEYPKKNIDLQSKVPIDGVIISKEADVKKLSSLLLKSLLPLGNQVEKLTFLDLIRLSLFARTIPTSAIYTRQISDALSMEQIETVISLTFQDAAIYEENKTIEVVNASSINGMGGRIATFVANIGGNPILVTSDPTNEPRSKILYYGKQSYTVKRLSDYFDLPVEKIDKRGLADIIIIIGKDIERNRNL